MYIEQTRSAYVTLFALSVSQGLNKINQRQCLRKKNPISDYDSIFHAAMRRQQSKMSSIFSYLLVVVFLSDKIQLNVGKFYNFNSEEGSSDNKITRQL